MPTEDFFQELRALGYEVTETPNAPGGGIIDYEIPVGPRIGEQVKLAFFPPGDWPLTPPSGPYIAPLLLPLNTSAEPGHPTGGVHPAPQLGDEWQYWSRPIPGWNGTGNVACYFAHIRHLFATL
jgi:hypothetical protein